MDYQGLLTAPKGARFAVACARWNDLITKRLHEGAIEALVRHGVPRDAIDTAWCPGCFELPITAKALADSGRYHAVLALGALIRGATPHFDYIASVATAGLGRVGLDAGIPVIYGVLTCDTIEQAIERAGTKAGNKGEEAATAALEMISLLGQVRGE